MARTDAFVAATRFGLGARPGDLARIDDLGPRPWLRAQLAEADPAVDARLATLPASTVGVLRMAEARMANEDSREMFKEETRDAFQEEQALLLSAAASSATPFRERLVAFWANHFTVSITRKEVVGVAGAFEREVVRAHLDGRFDEMLVASTRHPAMLGYLDNFRSTGPDSPVGRRTGKGLNENLAREVLELHSLGVGGGYGQADVEALARLLTGWSLDLGEPSAFWPMPGSAGTGGFAFHAARHQPGPITLLGKTYGGGGEQDGLAALRDLAHHPSTARHVARKLARAFVADDPPAAAVAALESAFVASGGHLPTVHAALVELPQAWTDPLPKLKTPWDLVLSTARMLGGSDGQLLLKSLRHLGQMPYQAPSPKGWPDEAVAWAGPEAVLARLEWAEMVSRNAPPTDPVALAQDALGPVLTPRTAHAMEKAGWRDGLALLLVSPEFQRR